MTLRRIVVLLAALAQSSPVRAPAQSAAAKLVVVVALGSPVTNLSKSDLKRVFLGETMVFGGKKMLPLNFAVGSKERTAFDRVVFGMSAGEVGRFWIDRKIRGQPDAPRSLPAAGQLIAVVAKFPGAIGYLPADQLSPVLQPVKVDGLAYTDAAYPLVLK